MFVSFNELNESEWGVKFGRRLGVKTRKRSRRINSEMEIFEEIQEKCVRMYKQVPVSPVCLFDYGSKSMSE